jgi:hypothetical protein
MNNKRNHIRRNKPNYKEGNIIILISASFAFVVVLYMIIILN